MASMVHQHHHHHHASTSAHGHSHQHQHSAGQAAGGAAGGNSSSSTMYSYTPSDFDLLRALTSGSAGKNTAKKALLKQQASSQRRPQLDPLILETAASSGPHVTRNHFLHEFYPHPEDPSSAFSWHAGAPSTLLGGGRHHGHSTFPSTRRPAYASCDVGPEEDEERSTKSHLQGAIEQHEYPTASTSQSSNGLTNGHGVTDPNTAKLPRAVEDTDDADDELSQGHAIYRSRQAPRKLRLERERAEQEELVQQGQDAKDDVNGPSAQEIAEDENAGAIHPNLKDVEPAEKLHHALEEPDSRTSIFNPDPVHLPQLLKISQPSFFHPYSASASTTIPSMSIPTLSKPPLQVVCYARTRVPTPHGEVFLHIYKNNWDDKEHLAFVFDRDQLLDSNTRSGTQVTEHGEVKRDQRYGTLRSRTLDSTWRKGETDVERIVRGAYVGRLSPTSAEVSRAATTTTADEASRDTTKEEASNCTRDDAVLVRIHSECFTGETIGSQRCDCGEQLDEAFRLIGTSSSGLGIIIYLRQEGRGIGLLEKIKAYNLQDLGHDTVTANLLLGHGADQRDYALAGEMLRDLGVGGNSGRNVRLLTNNPDKIDSIEKEGIKVVERVPMVPRGWTVHMPHLTNSMSSSKKKKKVTKTGTADPSSSKSKQKRTTKRRPKMDMQDSVTSIRSVAAAESSAASPLPSPALSSSSAPRFKPKNKKLEALKPLSSSMDADGIRSVEASASEAEVDAGVGSEDDATVDSYEMPSMPGSADERESGEAPESAEEENSEEEDEEDDEGEDDSEDSAEREEALEDYLISMNRTGVGMIGAGVTHSKELEKYLKTKIERMGHMLVAPAAPPSTPLPLRRGARLRQHHGSSQSHTAKKESKLKNEHPSGDGQGGDNMAESTASIIKTDEESIKCDAGNECEDCKRQAMEDGYFADETYGEDMFG